MTKPGPKKKPTELEILQGKPGHRPINTKEPKPKPIEKIPEPPKWMSSEGKKLYKRITPILTKFRLLTEADLETLNMGCDSYGNYVEAQQKLSVEGRVVLSSRGDMRDHPLVKQSHNYFLQYKNFMSEFGLSPSSRTRLHVDVLEEINELTDFLNKYK